MVQYPVASAMAVIWLAAVGKLVVGEVVVVMMVVMMVVGMVVVVAVVVVVVEMFDMKMAVWLASQVVLPALIAAKQIWGLWLW
jgi:uncharacterized membrane protein